MGLNGVDNGRIWFDHVKVPRVEMLNRFADVTADGQYRSDIQSQGARFFTMIGTLGQRSDQYRRHRQQRGQERIDDCCPVRRSPATVRFTESDPGNSAPGLSGSPTEALPTDRQGFRSRLCPEAPDRTERNGCPDNSRSLETLAAGLKAVTTWNATQTIQTCREACGGEGYLAVNRISALKADTDIYTTFEGDNTVLMQLVAKNLLSEFKDRLKEMRPAQMAGFFIDQRSGRHRQAQSRDHTSNSGQSHLRDIDFQIAMFRFRESATLFSAARSSTA